jgi:type II secretory pathway component GspD/PulD (secretin)/beta-lactamase regulating signal transducer with metallopeptidase domain
MSANDLWQAVVRPDAGLFVQLTWALGHFLWQGCAIAIGYAVLARLLRRASANVRYTAGVAALLLMAAALPATLWLQSPQETPLAFDSTTLAPASIPSASDAGEAALAASSGDEPADAAVVRYVPPPAAISDAAQEPLAAERIRAILSQASPYVGSVYLVGLMMMLLRVALGLWSGRRLRGQCEPISDWAVLDVLRRNARRMGLRVVPAIACCGRISVPIVVGVLRPMILLPASFASGLSPAQVEAVLAHELAHIRRFDLAVNVFQRLVEAVLFFHPAVWWVSRRVSLERENACDDAVLRLDHERVQYADALLRLAELCAGGAADGVALAATRGKSSQFRRRVLRLLAIDEKPPVRLTSFGVLASLLLATLLVVAPLMWRNAVSAEPKPAAVGNAGEGGFMAGVKDARDTSPSSGEQPKPSTEETPRLPAAKGSADVVRAGNEAGPAASSSPAAGPRLLTACADDLDVRKVLEMLNRESKANIVVSPGVSGKVTMNVRDKTLDEILAMIARVCRLVVRRDGDATYVSTLAEVRKSEEGRLPVRLYRLKYAKSSDVLNVISTLKSAKGKATKASDDGEVVLVQDYEDVLKEIERVIAACDTQGGAMPPAYESHKPAAAPVAGRSPVTVHAESLDVRKVLELLSRHTASNMIVSPRTSGQLTMDIRDRPFDEALAMIAKVCNLVIRHEGDTVIVSTLAEERKAEEDRLPIRLYRLKYVKSSDVLNITATLKSAKGRSTKLSDGGNGEAVVVQDYEDVLKIIDRVIAQIDVRPVQVLIDAVLLEAKAGAVLAVTKELAKVEFTKFAVKVGEANARKAVVGLDAATAPGMPSPLNAPTDPNAAMFGFLGQNRDRFLKLLEAKGETRVLAAPRLLTLNKQLAQIELGDLMTKHVPANTADGKWKVGFRPFVSSDGNIRLEIHLGDRYEPGGSNVMMPPGKQTIVVVPSGAASATNDPAKTELVMLVTTVIMKESDDDVPEAGGPNRLNIGEPIVVAPRATGTAPTQPELSPAYRPAAVPPAPTALPTAVAAVQSDADKDDAERTREETRRRIIEKALAVIEPKPPAPQEKRIEAALKIIRVCDLSRDDTKTWATALRELIVIGKPAVPKLIEQLDRTQRNHSLRALGFVLRGIGDPRAVPALIRAIPRTLEASTGSDCGLAIRDDLELARFMREHDNEHVGKPDNAARDSAEFSFGRPINEIMPALAKITGQDFEWREFRFAYTDAGPDATRVQRKAFLDHAQRWANGWSKNWRKYVANESEAQLELTRQAIEQYAKTIPPSPKQPRTEFPHGRRVKAGNHSIDQFIKSFDEWPDSGFHDLDTGRLIKPPKSLQELSPKNEPSEKLIVWARVEGVDLINIKRKSPGSDKWHYAFLPVDMTVWRIAGERFANVEMELRASKKLDLPAPWKGPLEQVDEKTGLYDDSLSATYLFITKEGVCGVLRLEPPLSRELIPGQISSNKGGLHCKYIYESDERADETGRYSLPTSPPAAAPVLPVMPRAGGFGVE